MAEAALRTSPITRRVERDTIRPPRLADAKQRSTYPGAGLTTFRCALLARHCVASVFENDPLLLMGKPRGSRQLAIARQLAIHLVHIVAGRSHEDVAKAFSRNRSTASHHFEVVEDLRDDTHWDGFVTLIELQYTRLLELAEVQAKPAFLKALLSLANAVEEGNLEGDAHRTAEYVVATFKGAA